MASLFVWETNNKPPRLHFLSGQALAICHESTFYLGSIRQATTTLFSIFGEWQNIPCRQPSGDFGDANFQDKYHYFITEIQSTALLTFSTK